MFNIVLSNMAVEPRRLESLNKQAEEEIKLRGYNPKDGVIVPPELRREEWFLPINEIVSDYCPTDRYSYLRKYCSDVKLELTWEMFKGKIFDEFYKDLFEASLNYVKTTKLCDLYIKENLEKIENNRLEKIKKEIDKYRERMVIPPTSDEISGFLRDISKLIRYETQLCGTIVDFRVSTKFDINIESEVALLFPFNFKAKISAINLGFTKGAEPDFIYAGQVIGDIKTGRWRDSFNLTLAAYALAYENENQKDMNLGVILNPFFDDNRSVPLYTKSSIGIIDDIYRKAVFILRNKKLELMKKRIEPPVHNDENFCLPCGYHNSCWGKDS